MVLASGMTLDKSVHVKGDCFTKALFQSALKVARLDPGIKSEKDLRVGCAIGDVIGLILCKALAEVAPRILGPRMALEREVPAIERVEVVEADGEFGAEPFSEGTKHRQPLLKHE